MLLEARTAGKGRLPVDRGVDGTPVPALLLMADNMPCCADVLLVLLVNSRMSRQACNNASGKERPR